MGDERVMKVHIKLLLLFLCTSLLLLAGCLTINTMLFNEANQQEREQLKNQLLMSADRMQNRLDLLDEQVIFLSVATNINRFHLYNRMVNMSNIVDMSQSIFWELQVLKGSNPIVQSFFLMFPNQNRQITSRLRYGDLDSRLFELLNAADQNAVLDCGLLYSIYPLSTAGLNNDGALAGVSLSPQAILEELTLDLGWKMNARLILNGECIADNGNSEFPAVPAVRAWAEEKEGFGMSIPLQLNSMGALLTMEIFLPRQSMRLTAQTYFIWAFFLVFLTLCSMFIFIMLLKRIVKQPLQNILTAFDRLAGGDQTVRIHHTSHDEFADLYSHFNDTADQLVELLFRQYQAELTAKRAELKQLQTQIQPHFLYNAFYQLYRICRMGETDQAADFSLLLSQYYSYITHTDRADGLVSLAQEMDHAMHYASIQQFRYGERLSVVFDALPEEARRQTVPKLLIQPIVENAVKYGFEAGDGDSVLHIRVSVRQEDAFLFITVTDDGKSISGEKLAAMRRRLETAVPSGENSGLVNVHLRLRLLHPEAGVRLRCNESGGLTVELAVARTAGSVSKITGQETTRMLNH